MSTPEPTVRPRARVGPYRCGREIGRGGGGTVYAARHTRTGAQVALKIVSTRDELRLPALRREIRHLKRLRYPFIVRILDDGLDDDPPWFAMERVEGETLRSFSDALPPGRGEALAARLAPMARLFDALAALHGEGLVHRDLKPENVLVRGDSAIVLLDFGLAARVAGPLGRETLESEGEPSGSEGYMAPEQWRGEPPDARADLYAAGVVLFELLAGRLPFTRAADVLDPSLPAPPLPHLVPGVPAALGDLVARLLAKRLEERVGYAEDAARLLRAACRMAAVRRRPGLPYLYRPALLGRDGLLAVIEQELGCLARGHGALLLVGGESGIGKTRLALEVARRARARGINVVKGAGRSPEASLVPLEPLEPLFDVAHSLSDRCRARGPEEAEQLLGERAAVLAAAFPAFSTAAARPPAPLPPEAARRRLLKAVSETLLAYAKEAPLLLVIDDLQWCDAATSELLALLAEPSALARAPLACFVTYRSDGPCPQAERLAGLRTVRLRLDRLEPDAVGRLAAGMLALGSSEGDGITQLVATRAAGNPLFAAEYLRAAVARGWLRRDPGRGWQIVRMRRSALPLPGSLRTLLGQRIQALPRDLLRICGAASVLPSTIEPTLLASIARTREPALAAAIDRLVVHGILWEAEPGRLAFAHDALRTAAYRRMSRARRRALHRSAASALCRLAPERRDPHLADIALHAARGGLSHEARTYFLRAARRAAARQTLPEAEALYRAHLLRARSDSAEAVRARLELVADVLRPLSRIDDALATARRALRLARRVARGRLHALALHEMGILHAMKGQERLARKFLVQALRSHRARRDRALEGRTLGSLANLAKHAGHTQEARHLYRLALRCSRASGDLRSFAIYGGNLANLEQKLGRLSRARALFRTAIAAARKSGDTGTCALHTTNLAGLHLASGEPAAAAAAYEEALAIARRASDRAQEAMALGGLAAVHEHRGSLDLSRACYEEARAASRRGADLSTASVIHAGLAALDMAEGDLGGARRHAIRALRLARTTGGAALEALPSIHLARIAARQGRMRAAMRRYRHALSVTRASDDRILNATIPIDLAMLEARRPDVPARSAEHLDEAGAILAHVRALVPAALLWCARGHIALRTGSGDASACLQRAEALALAAGCGEASEAGRAVEGLRLACASASPTDLASSGGRGR